jgi:hypothetical protein
VLAVRAQTRDSYEKAENLHQRGRDAGGGDRKSRGSVWARCKNLNFICLKLIYF